MEKEQYRSVIRFLFLEGKTCDEIKVRMHAVYRDCAPSMTTIRYWFNEFKRGRTTVFDEDRSGRPIEVTTDDMVKKIENIVLADRRIKLREIVDAVNVSIERVQNILEEILDMKKVSARWVPRLLTEEQKRNRLTTSEQCSAVFKRNSKEFLRRFVTVNETWVHHYTPK